MATGKTTENRLETSVAVMQRDIEYLKSASDDNKKMSEAILTRIDNLSFVTAKDYEKDMKALSDKVDSLRKDFDEFKEEYETSKPGIRFSNLLESKATTFIVGAIIAAVAFFLIQQGVAK